LKKQLILSLKSVWVLATVAIFHSACEDDKLIPFVIGSSAFSENEAMPNVFTCGDGISPPLSFSEIPDEVESLVVVAEDLDRISGIYTQWMIWNLPPKVMVTEDVNGFPIEGAVMGTADDSKTVGYLAPCPSKGDIHRIVFRAYGLDRPIDLKEGANRAQFDAAVRKHRIAEAALTAEAVGK
jgi:Raf kinase inhibitor-like YbhB/YbcL family protein